MSAEHPAARSRLFLRLASTRNGVSVGPRYYDFPVFGQKSYWCMGCGTTIAQGDAHARAMSSGRICSACVGAATDATAMIAPTEPTARVHASPDTMAILMDGAADELGGRVTTIAIAWDDYVTSEVAQQLSRDWAAQISGLRVVVATRVRVYGNRRLGAVA